MADKPLTALQENAARLFVEGNTQSDAYRKAGYKYENMSNEVIQVEACRLFALTNVSLRVQELQASATARHAVTVDSLTEEYNEAKGIAYGLEQTGAAIQAINGKAKIHGFDKVVYSGEVKTLVRIVDLTGKTDE